MSSLKKNAVPNRSPTSCAPRAMRPLLSLSSNLNSRSGCRLTVEDAIFLAQHIEVPDRETDDSWLSLEYIEEVYEETEEQRKPPFTRSSASCRLRRKRFRASVSR